MVSINSVSVNRAVLATLRQTDADLATTQNRIASGLKVASARDNASVWATAQTIRKDIASQETIDGNLALAKGQADAALTAVTSIQDILSKIKTAADGLDDSNASVANNLQIKKTVAAYNEQLLALTKSATIQGVNLLSGTGVTISGGTGTLTTAVGNDLGNNINMTFTVTQVLDATGANGSLATLYGYGASSSSAIQANMNGTKSTVISTITTAIADMNTYANSLANYTSGLTAQQDFYGKIKDIRSTALSALVDADMTEESARLQALQVKQQLAYQALSVGNSSSQNILRLFQ